VQGNIGTLTEKASKNANEAQKSACGGKLPGTGRIATRDEVKAPRLRVKPNDRTSSNAEGKKV